MEPCCTPHLFNAGLHRRTSLIELNKIDSDKEGNFLSTAELHHEYFSVPAKIS